MNILLTAFDPFHNAPLNSSQQVMIKIAGLDLSPFELRTCLLPTTYRGSADLLIAAIDELSPRAIIMLGMHGGPPIIRLERLAVNVNDTPTPDNTGEIATARAIALDGVPQHETTLPIDEMLAALREASIAVELSHDAGRFVCNHVFYIARMRIEQARCDCLAGFIHLPRVDESRAMGLPLSVMSDGVTRCLRIVRDHLLGAPK